MLAVYPQRVISRIVLILVVAIVPAGCGSSSHGRKTALAAFYPIAYAAGRIGGSSYDVEDLTPPGVEPHDLELSPRTVTRIETAHVVLYLGHGFQPAVAKAAAAGRGTRVDLLSGLPLHDSDPHVWLDPILFERVVRRIGTTLPRPAAPLLADLHPLDAQSRS